MEEIKLYNADCLNILKTIPNNSIDLIIIDPPYDFMTKHKSNNYTGAGAFGKLGRSYHGELENDNMIKGINENVLKELVRVMKKINIYIYGVIKNKSIIIYLFLNNTILIYYLGIKQILYQLVIISI